MTITEMVADVQARVPALGLTDESVASSLTSLSHISLGKNPAMVTAEIQQGICDSAVKLYQMTLG